MYDVDITPESIVVSLNGDMVMTLREGNTLLIGLSYENINRHDSMRAQDFIHGVLMGVNHVALTGKLPAIVALN